MLGALVFSLFFIAGTRAECPNINDLPVMTAAGDSFYCFWIYAEKGGDIPLEGCNGQGYSYLDGADEDSPAGYYWPIGSAIVKAGCTLYGYELNGFTGARIDYSGPATYPDGCSGSNCPPVIGADDGVTSPRGFRSYKCRCQQDPIICTPSDKYVTIMQCDNTRSDVDTLCQYTKTIGTTFTNTAQESMSIDTSIEYAMEASFFSFFKESLGVSVSTGYDWTQTSSEAKSETHSYTVRTTVPPHKLLIIEGAEGDCGGNIVQTELFRISTVDVDGNVESQYIDTSTLNIEHISKE